MKKNQKNDPKTYKIFKTLRYTKKNLHTTKPKKTTQFHPFTAESTRNLNQIQTPFGKLNQKTKQPKNIFTQFFYNTKTKKN